MNAWLWAAAVLVVPLAGLAVVAVRRPVLEGVIALEAAGVDAALILLLLAEGTRRQPFADLAIVLAVMSFAGGIAFVRFLERLR
jgi:multisubunit Na+/H+ antiporter MnhF subunit